MHNMHAMRLDEICVEYRREKAARRDQHRDEAARDAETLLAHPRSPLPSNEAQVESDPAMQVDESQASF